MSPEMATDAQIATACQDPLLPHVTCPQSLTVVSLLKFHKTEENRSHCYSVKLGGKNTIKSNQTLRQPQIHRKTRTHENCEQFGIGVVWQSICFGNSKR